MKKAPVLLMLASALVAALGICPVAFAEENQSDPDAWRFRFIPYLWFVGLNGTSTVRGNTVDFDANFGEIISNSDSVFAFQGVFAVRRGRWGGYLDGTYVNLGTDDTTAGPVILDTSTEIAYFEFGALYEAAGGHWRYTGMSPDHPGLRWMLDFLAGGRFTSMSTDLEFKTGPPPLPTNVSASQSWTDPIIGIRAETDLSASRRWDLEFKGDVGGFGVGSDLTWELLGVLGYNFKLFKADGAVAAGYRALYQDFETGSGLNKFAWDATVHGPILGLDIRW